MSEVVARPMRLVIVWFIRIVRLRNPTSVASVATNGGSFTMLISQACHDPMSVPTVIATTIPNQTAPFETMSSWSCRSRREEPCLSRERAHGGRERNHGPGGKVDAPGDNDNRNTQLNVPSKATCRSVLGDRLQRN